MNVSFSFSNNRIQATDTGNSPISPVKTKTMMPVEVKRILQPEEQTNVPLKLTIRWKNQEEQPHIPLLLTIRWKKKETAPKLPVSLPLTIRWKSEAAQEMPNCKRKRIEDPTLAAKRPRVEVKLETPNIRDTKFREMITTNALAQKKTLSRPIWTPEEDQKLLAGVKLHGHNWALISRECLGGTYNRHQCCHRYRNVIHPNRIKGPWTAEEKKKLLTGVEKFGLGKWTQIAKNYFNWTRSDLDLSTEYRFVLDPESKLGPWKPKEDAKLIKLRKNGLKWTEIAEQMERSASRCRERFSTKIVTDKLKGADT